MQLNHAVEIIGKVQNDLSVRVMASTDFGGEGDTGMFDPLFLELMLCVEGVVGGERSLLMCVLNGRFQCRGGGG